MTPAGVPGRLLTSGSRHLLRIRVVATVSEAGWVGRHVFWAHLLTARDLFSKTSPFITFSDLLEFPVEFGIHDEDWIAKAEPEEKEQLQESENAELQLIYEG